MAGIHCLYTSLKDAGALLQRRDGETGLMAGFLGEGEKHLREKGGED